MPSPVTLLWIPLGAGRGIGARVVRANGVAYERLTSWRERRAPRALFHAALIVRTRGTVFTVELGPAWGNAAAARGDVMTGPVGVRCGSRVAALRYELRVWPDGVIADPDWAVGGPVALPATAEQAARIIALAPALPRLTWGRDELGCGDMWNSNSAIAWLLAHAGIEAGALAPPVGGRAPGWRAGLSSACARPIR